MGKRSSARRLAMQAIYQSDVSHIDIEKALDNLFEEEKFNDETRSFAKRLAIGTQGNKTSIDEKIAGMSKNWSIGRINAINRSILKLALYELENEDTPKAVIIDEALELAKRYSDDESAKFINGILDSAVV